MTYSEKLKHPLWQKKRLEVMQRDGWKCCHCHRGDITLNVHHLNYRGENPWDALNSELTTLCENCHELVHNVPPITFYLAGKITKNGWRNDIFPGLTDVSNSENFRDLICDNAIVGIHKYSGPYFLSCHHGCSHQERQHGVGDSSCQFHDCCNNGQWSAYLHCKTNIENCQVVFAWIDKLDCYGTLFELGFAEALRKKIYIALSTELSHQKPEMWFPLMAAEKVVISPTAVNGFQLLLPDIVHRVNSDIRRVSPQPYTNGGDFLKRLREVGK